MSQDHSTTHANVTSITEPPGPPGRGGVVRALWQSLRPQQWTKNLIVLAPLLFSEQRLARLPEAWGCAGLGFLVFALLSGAVYLLNDLVDRERDRLHPDKRKRPIASGRLAVTTAKMALLVLLFSCLAVAAQLSWLFFVTALSYFCINIAYSFWLKNMVIVDVMTIGVGFVLRALGGVGALRPIDAAMVISHWFLLCTFLLALFLAMAKRRQEISKLKHQAAPTRAILSEYSLHFIDEMTAVVTASTVMAYALYTIAPETVAKFKTDKLIYTVPFVLYGIFRYLYLVHIKSLGDKPSEVLLADLPLKINLVLYTIVIVLILY